MDPSEHRLGAEDLDLLYLRDPIKRLPCDYIDVRSHRAAEMEGLRISSVRLAALSLLQVAFESGGEITGTKRKSPRIAPGENIPGSGRGLLSSWSSRA